MIYLYLKQKGRGVTSSISNIFSIQTTNFKAKQIILSIGDSNKLDLHILEDIISNKKRSNTFLFFK